MHSSIWCTRNTTVVDRKELDVNHVQPRRQGRRILCAGSSIGIYHGMVTMKWSGVWGQHKRSTDICLSSQIPVSSTHIQWCLLSVIPPGSAGPCTDIFIAPLFLRCFPCVSFKWLHTITCAKLSLHSVLMITNHQWTRQQIVLLFHCHWWLLNDPFSLEDALKNFK